MSKTTLETGVDASVKSTVESWDSNTSAFGRWWNSEMASMPFNDVLDENTARKIAWLAWVEAKAN